MANKRVELLVERSTKHGQAGRETRSRTYLIWQSMIGRCHRPSDSSYKYYGAKGITVCDRWRKFEDFFTDMGEAPDGMHIHRTNGATVYSKETCQWMSEHEHIGLHNTEQGWGARMTRAQLIDALAGAKQQLAAERQESDKRDQIISTQMDQLDAERSQLAAEKERYNFKANLAEEIVRLNHQLAEAQAAMRDIQGEVIALVDAEKLPNSVLHKESPRRIKDKVNAFFRGDATALDAAITKAMNTGYEAGKKVAQKPLVDALTKAAETFNDLKVGLRLLGKPDIAKACEIAEEYSVAVLAKVKK